MTSILDSSCILKILHGFKAWLASINFYSLNIEQNPKRIPSYSRKINWEKLRPIQLGPRSISRYTVFLNLPRLLLYVHLQYNILLANTVQAGYTKSLLTRCEESIYHHSECFVSSELYHLPLFLSPSLVSTAWVNTSTPSVIRGAGRR